ncbi:MAG: hypothetical protein AAGF14_03300, partial [Pseudomonadota bacterium]
MAISLNAVAAQLLVPTDPGIDTQALRSGQVIEARVASTGQGGTPQIVIGNQSIDISAALKLQEGALVRLLVQGTGPNVRLTVLPTPVPAQAPPQSSAPPATVPPPQSAQQASQAQSAHARPVPAAGSTSASAQSASVSSVRNAQVGSAAVRAQTAIVIP